MAGTKPDPRKPWKAVGAAVIAGAGAFATAIADGHITGGEGAFIATSVVGAALGVYHIKNPSISW